MTKNANIKWELLCIGGMLLVAALSTAVIPWGTHLITCILGLSGVIITVIGGFPLSSK